MKIELFPFQKVALEKLRQSIDIAHSSYSATHIPQIVSYTAPTGAGKTIIMAALIESIYYGDENYVDQNDAIIVWLSDSPQLNEQSRIKIETKADKCFGRCVTISDDSFDREILDDGHIYFLNTQKLSKTSNLTKHSDMRQYTIWETLENTIQEKADRLYFIIDEAHRGAQKSSDLAKATTIMQKFLKGSPADKLSPMPIVIGMTATSQRFHRLAENIQSTTHYVLTTADEVRASGLLKDRIVISYPEVQGNDMAVLQAAADEWKEKWEHWEQYCREQHYAYINPIFVIQVQNGNSSRISCTDLDECIRAIEERTGERFVAGQVVHAFGEGTPTLQICGLDVPYVEPSRIADDKRIKVVFFKETLSTGWDCPRAETMMSFRHAVDYTYIAQLLGRMVRTPMQMRIRVDETLNDVHLYLPQFNEKTVYDVVEALRSSEGANIPTDIEMEEMGEANYETLTLTPTYTVPQRQHGQRVVNVDPGQMSLFDIFDGKTDNNGNEETVTSKESDNVAHAIDAGSDSSSSDLKTSQSENEQYQERKRTEIVKSIADIEIHTFDRQNVVKAVNEMGLLTYHVRNVMISNYLKSLFSLARFLSHITRIDMDVYNNVMNDVLEIINDYILTLKNNGLYESLAEQVLQFKLSTQIFDVFGTSIDNYQIHDLFSTTDTDIERQFRLAEARLGHEGIANAYCNRYFNNDDILTNRINVILFAADSTAMDSLNAYAKKKFHEINDNNRRKTVSLPEKYKKKYDDIVSDGDIISKHNFRLPETIRMPKEQQGIAYTNHLFVDNSGTAVIDLNGWEQKVIAEEQKQEDFVCWIRNPSRGSWALCIPYEMNGVKKPMYPDFLIVRKDECGSDYIVDILEPHDPTRTDNFGKAKGLAEYARQNPGVGRIQLIKMKKDSLGNERPFRLDMSKSSVRDKVLYCVSNDELVHIFDEYGFFN